MIKRRTLALAGLPFMMRPAQAQAWPTRPIRLVVPWPPGQATDQVGRLMAQRLSERLGQPIVPENRPGAGGSIGTDMVAKAAPDGYTYLLGTAGTHAINPALYKNLSFDVQKDFAPIELLGDVPNVLLVNPKKHPEIKTLIALSKLAKYAIAVIAAAMRTGSISRKTNETSIDVEVNLDGSGVYDVSTGIGFLDHMLEQLSRHSLIDLKVKAIGDLHIDQHHTTEDTGIAIGEAVLQALSDKRGITRYGTAYAPMDETLTRCALDISGRPYFVWKVSLGMPRLGEWDTELIEHWFHSFATSAGITLHIENLYGSNNHHIVESCYKALARALRQAVEIDPRKADAIPSTKGTL